MLERILDQTLTALPRSVQTGRNAMTARGIIRPVGTVSATWGVLGAACSGAPDGDRRYALNWMDRLSLENLVLVPQVVARAALARTDRRGAHFREDFPDASDLATSHYTVVRQRGGDFDLATEPVRFTHVRPGGSLLDFAA